MRILFLVFLLSGCAATPIQPTEIQFKIDRFGVKYPVVNGVEYLPTDAERLIQRDLLVEEYCR